MTRRLAVVITAVVLCTLLLAGFGSLAVGNIRARHTTEQEVRRQAIEVAGNISTLIEDPVGGAGPDDGPALLRRALQSLQLFRTALNVDGLAVLTARTGGLTGAEQLPRELELSMFPVQRLRDGDVISGNRGKLVFAAAPTVLPNGRLIVIVLFRNAASALPAAWGTLFVAGLCTLAIGVLAAIVLGRRLSKPIRDASAATIRIAGGELSTRLPEPSANDHDELAELARSVNVMAGELQRARVLEQQFLLSISHDLRTPLTSIRGYAEAIGDGAGDPQQSAAVIRSEARRLERLVADLLDLAKLRSNGFSLHLQPVDLVALASATAHGFELEAAERHIVIRPVQDGPTGGPVRDSRIDSPIDSPIDSSIDSSIDGRIVQVIADHDRLAQVVANLIENALRYARSEVAISVGRNGTTVVLAVDDDGPGIAEADLAHVFDRLYVARSQPVRQESSSGLGLAIVKELVEAMGGTVHATRAPIGGARLVVGLPQAPA